MQNIFGAEFRRVDNREHLGKPALVVVAARTYPTTIDDLWNAITTPERIVRWFSRVEGDLKVGGRYKITGNASGTITRCDPPEAFDLTWEMRGDTSWVNVRLARDGKNARLTLEHIAHRDAVSEEFLKQFGPGAVGIGWDLSLHGLEKHFAAPATALDDAWKEAWTKSSEGLAFMRASGEAWCAAHIESGEDPETARAQGQRTINAYTGG
jgi:uncharacterized protein YndB with AHSA1/START domain